MASRKLDDLSDKFRPIVFEFLARLVEVGYLVIIVDTLRSLDEQKRAVANGTSWTMNSRHLADATGKSNAIDICPLEMYALHGGNKLQWDAADPVWNKIGAIGQGLGLKWGVVDKTGIRKDLGHFEYHVEPTDIKTV